jgi:hypothetical protein
MRSAHRGRDRITAPPPPRAPSPVRESGRGITARRAQPGGKAAPPPVRPARPGAHYGNRAGLLLAMARHRDEASGFRSKALATRDLGPDAALVALLGAWLDYLPELLPVARALEAAHVAGDEGGAAWQDRMEEPHEALRFAVERIFRAGGLASPWTVDAATDWIWARVQLSAWLTSSPSAAGAQRTSSSVGLGPCFGSSFAAERARGRECRTPRRRPRASACERNRG